MRNTKCFVKGQAMAKSPFTRKTWAVIAGVGVLVVGGVAIGTATAGEDSSGSDNDFKTASAAEDSNDDRDTDGRKNSSAPKVSAGEAASIALDDVGEAVVTSVELESDGAYWDVDLTGPKQEHEVKVHSDNGKVADRDSDDDSDDWKEDSAVAKAASINIDEAVSAASSDLPNASVTSVELEGNPSNPKWEVEMRTDDGETTVTVNAKDGSILKQYDDDDDDDDHDDGDDDRNDDD